MSNSFPSISGLIPQLKAGDQSAWDKLCNQFRDGLIAKTRKFLHSTKLGKRCSAEDLVQEAFLKAWKQHESFRGQTTSQFAKWILVILKNTFIDLARRNNFELSSPHLYEPHDLKDSPSVTFLNQEREAILHASLAELDSRSREILLLRHFEGLTLAEIAYETGLNINTVASICRRSHLRLSAYLESYEESRASRAPQKLQ